MNSKDEIIEKLREIKPLLIKDYSVSKIGLFGSFVDNLNDDSSDIDLLVELNNPIGWRFLSLEIFLEKTFGRKIDLVTKNALKDQIRDQILSQVEYV